MLLSFLSSTLFNPLMPPFPSPASQELPPAGAAPTSSSGRHSRQGSGSGGWSLLGLLGGGKGAGDSVGKRDPLEEQENAIYYDKAKGR
jgi:hypothetical protein